MGLGAQMIHWDDEFCRQLAARGFRVIRFDNRDIGKSSKLTGGKRLTRARAAEAAVPENPGRRALQAARHGEGHRSALMDALGIKSAHLVGASMGGMIAQEIAISFPQRVRSLTSIMSTTGNPKMPPPTREAAAMLMAPPPASKEEYFARFAQTWKVLRAGIFPRRRGARPRARRAHLRARPQSGRRRPAAPRHPRLRQPQGAAARGKGADAGHPRHRRSAGASRGRQGHRGLDSRRQARDDRRHGSRAADPDVAADHRRDRQARQGRGGEGGVILENRCRPGESRDP